MKDYLFCTARLVYHPNPPHNPLLTPPLILPLLTQAKAIGLVALSAFSRRAGKKVRNIFIDTINNGGLSLLNELVIDASGNEIVAVMKLVADSENYPIGLFCTAGTSNGMLLIPCKYLCVGLGSMFCRLSILLLESYCMHHSMLHHISERLYLCLLHFNFISPSMT